MPFDYQIYVHISPYTSLITKNTIKETKNEHFPLSELVFLLVLGVLFSISKFFPNNEGFIS